MDTLQLVNSNLSAEMGMRDVASVLTHLERQQHDLSIAGELNILGGISRWQDASEQEFPYAENFERRPDGTLRHGHSDETELDFLERVQEQLEHPGLRARINELLHRTRPDHLRARDAVDGHIAFARSQEHRVNTDPHEGTVAWRRAADLSKRLGKKSPLHVQVLDGIEAAIARHEHEDRQGWYSFRLMELLLTYRHGDAVRYAALSESLALRAEAAGNLPMSSRHWGMAEQWHRRAGNVAEESRTRVLAAEALVTDALDKERAGMSSFLVSEELTRALRRLRESGATQTRIEEVHRHLRAVQRTPPEGMQELALELDPEVVKRLREFGRAAVAGKAASEALSELAGLMAMMPRAEVERQVRQQMKETVAWQLATFHIQDREGRAQPAPQTEAEHLEHGIYRQQDICRFLTGFSLEAAMTQIRSEHSLTKEDLEALVRDHPRIPDGHRGSLLRGLEAGLEDDFLSAVPILIPQIEAILRHVLDSQGMVTSGLDQKGVQQEHNMNAFLTDEPYLAALGTVFDETLLFDLRGLLIEKSGRNLRNLVAHGLATDAEIGNETGRYVWFLVIQILASGKDERSEVGETKEAPEDSREDR